MTFVRVNLPLIVPKWLHSPLQRVKRRIVPPKPAPVVVTLSGDRDVEWSFIAASLPEGPGEALDFGCNGTYLNLIAARRGFKVVALDFENQILPWRHPNRRFVQGDVLEVALPNGSFDVVINCSTVEHVGLAGRYSVSKARPDGDLDAMRRLRDLMKTDGVQLLTIPLGRDAVFNPWHRVYGEKRLPALLDGYDVVHSEFWHRSQEEGWAMCSREKATNFQAAWDEQRKIYALGCFVLRRFQ